MRPRYSLDFIYEKGKLIRMAVYDDQTKEHLSYDKFERRDMSIIQMIRNLNYENEKYENSINKYTS